MIQITNKLPDIHCPDFGEPLPPDLIGSTLIAFGAPVDIPGVSLAIRYQPAGTDQPKVLTLAFDGSRIWALSPAQLSQANARGTTYNAYHSQKRRVNALLNIPLAFK